MAHLDVRVPSADVREHHAVLVLERLEQVLGRVGVGLDVGEVVDQHVRGPVDGTALLEEEHVAVAAEPGVARPLVAREHDEPAVRVELGRELVQMVPEHRCDLEVVALVAAHVEERLVAREGEELAGGVRADGLLGLAVQVAPVRLQGHRLRDAQRVGEREHAASGASISIRRSPGVATERSSTTIENVPGVNRTVSGSPSTSDGARRLCRSDVVGRARSVELGLPHVAREAVDDLDAAGVVDPEVAGRIGQGEGLKCSRFEASRGIDGGAAHAMGKICRMGHIRCLPTCTTPGGPAPPPARFHRLT